MTEYKLDGITVNIGESRIVTEGTGFRWFANIGELADGTLILAHSLSPDSADLQVSGRAVFVSDDRGKTWPTYFDSSTAIASGIPQADGSIGGPASRSYVDPAGDPDTYLQHFATVGSGGKHLTVDFWGATLSGLPRRLKRSETAPEKGNLVQVSLMIGGDLIPIDDGRILSTAYLTFDGDTNPRYSLVAITTDDGGRNWTYHSTIAGPQSAENMKEGPCEPSMIRLEDGDLMVVARVGGGSDQYLVRSYSSDNGKTWSVCDRLPAFSVLPTLMRLQNGVIFLATGRPGIDFWFSADPRGQEWQRINFADHHNAQYQDPAYSIVPEQSDDRETRRVQAQTTAYTNALEIEPNRILLVYDRLASGWSAVPADSSDCSRVHVIEIDVTRSA